MAYYIANDGIQNGPFELADLPSKGLKGDSLVWTEGMPDWKPASTVPEVAALLAPASAPIIPPVSTTEASPNSIPKAVVISNTDPAFKHVRPIGYNTPTYTPSNGMAVASMVLGIVSFPFTLLYCAGIITAILAIVFGFIARGKIARGETQVGAGMALAGIILGFAYLACAGLLILFFAFAASHS